MLTPEELHDLAIELAKYIASHPAEHYSVEARVRILTQVNDHDLIRLITLVERYQKEIPF
jgi:uncharacterized membrane protein YjjP (DUF1212 family)